MWGNNRLFFQDSYENYVKLNGVLGEMKKKISEHRLSEKNINVIFELQKVKE